jgi:hypothetical protein
MKNYKGYNYIVHEWRRELIHILNGYVQIPRSFILYKKIMKKETWLFGGNHRNYAAANDHLSAHGGFTFAEFVKKGEKYPQEFTPGLWIGWDYAHAGDCFYDHTDPRVKEMGLGTCMKGFNEKHWTAKEVEAECLDVIDQLIALDK